MPELKVIMLTSYSDDEALFEAIMAGASGYLLKQILGQDLVTAVRTVARGGAPLHPPPAPAGGGRGGPPARPGGPPAPPPRAGGPPGGGLRGGAAQPPE